MKVIIADDEPKICQLIIKLIDWEELNMTLVATANNGVTTLELIKEKSPDIVITDIRMPGYDGLELIERSKRLNPDLQFIIISGYSQFEYAKTAISHGVKDYLLKPINKSELNESLLRVKKSILEKERFVKIEKEYKDYIKKDIDINIKPAAILDDVNKNRVHIEQAKNYILLNYMNNITLEDIGLYIGFNPSYFSSIFKKETGISFVEYLSQVRIEKSKELLKEPDLKIQDISIMVGYSDVKYFSKLFSKHTGLSPKDYRKIFV